jgi:hypothetical protein
MSVLVLVVLMSELEPAAVREFALWTGRAPRMNASTSRATS